MIDVYIWCFVAYAVGTIVGLYMGRRWGIKIGSTLTFDLFVRLGYVKYTTNERGEVTLLKVQANDSDEL